MAGIRTFSFLLLASSVTATGFARDLPKAGQRRGELTTVAQWVSGPAPRQSQVGSEPIDPARSWDLVDALNRALEANPDLRMARAAVERQEGVYMQVRARLFPSITGMASAEQKDRGLIDRDFSLPPTPFNSYADRSYDARLEIRQVLFDGLGTWNQTRRQAFLQKQAVLQVSDAALRITSLVRQAFDAVLYRQSLVAVREASVDALSQVADMVTSRWRAGELPEYQSLRAQSSLKAAQADLAQAKSDLKRSEEVLRRLLVIPPAPDGFGIRLQGNLAQQPAPIPFADALARAKALRPDLQAAEMQLAAARKGVSAAHAGFFPQLEAYASYGYRSSYFDEDIQLQGWNVGLVGRWNIFDGLETTGRVKAQRAELSQAEIARAELDFEIGAQLKELYASLEQLESVIAAQRSAMELGERGLSQARRVYEIGQATLEEVLNAQLALSQSRSGLQQAVFNFNVAVYQIQYATGGRAEAE